MCVETRASHSDASINNAAFRSVSRNMIAWMSLRSVRPRSRTFLAPSWQPKCIRPASALCPNANNMVAGRSLHRIAYRFAWTKRTDISSAIKPVVLGILPQDVIYECVPKTWGSIVLRVSVETNVCLTLNRHHLNLRNRLDFPRGLMKLDFSSTSSKSRQTS